MALARARHGAPGRSPGVPYRAEGERQAEKRVERNSDVRRQHARGRSVGAGKGKGSPHRNGRAPPFRDSILPRTATGRWGAGARGGLSATALSLHLQASDWRWGGRDSSQPLWAEAADRHAGGTSGWATRVCRSGRWPDRGPRLGGRSGRMGTTPPCDARAGCHSRSQTAHAAGWLRVAVASRIRPPLRAPPVRLMFWCSCSADAAGTHLCTLPDGGARGCPREDRARTARQQDWPLPTPLQLRGCC